MPTILLTGAGGFIGRKMLIKLLGSGFFVYAISKKPLELEHSNLQQMSIDLATDFEDSLPSGIDIVLHLAQSKQYRTVPDGIEDIYAVNTHSTFRLLEWGRKNNIKKFIFASTGNVYGNQNKLLEETDLCFPNSFYAASKLAAEKYVEQYKPYFEVTILRFFGVYGESQENMTIPNLIQKVQKKEKITLAQGIGLEFTPIYISDCLEIVTKLMSKNDLSETIYNIAGNQVINIRNVAEIIANYLGLVPNFQTVTILPTFLKANILRISQTIDFLPNIKIEEGLHNILYAENNKLNM